VTESHFRCRAHD